MLPANQDARAALERIAIMHGTDNSAAFAIAASDALALPLVLFVDIEGQPVMAGCQISSGLFFGSSGPVNRAQLWQATRIETDEIEASRELIQRLFSVDESGVEEARVSFDQLSKILAANIYH